MLNRWTLQPGITDVRSQIASMAPWVSANLGKKVTMIFPDFAFGHDHRDFFTAAMAAQGGEVIAQIAIPADGDQLHPLFPADPGGNRGPLPCHGRPRRPDLRKGTGRVLRHGCEAADLRFHRLALEAVDTATPGLEFLEGTHFWEAHNRVKPADAGEHEAALPRRRRAWTTTAHRSAMRQMWRPIRHMFSTWETLSRSRPGWRPAGYTGPADRQKFVEAMEAMTDLPYGIERPQGAKMFNGKTHQVFGTQNISQVQGGKLIRVHQTSMADGVYEDAVDYTTMAF